MALFKRIYTKADPKTGRKRKCKTEKWYGQFRDLGGHVHRVPLATDKVAAQQMLADLVKQSERGHAGVSDPYAKHTWRPLTEHIKDFEKSTAANGATAKYTKMTAERVRDMVEGCEFRFIPDINADKVSTWLAEQREARSNFGVSTSNHYMRAMANFCNWLADKKRGNRCASSPYGEVAALDEETDVRRPRRALTDDEIAWLVDSTEKGPVIGEISGEDRAMLYRVALMTGLRASELKSLSPESFDVASVPSTVTVEACYSKHRKRDVLPLHSDIVPRLRAWLSTKAEGMDEAPVILSIKGVPAGEDRRLWTGPAVKMRRTAETVRRDLKLARKRWIEAATDDAEGKAREKSEFLVYKTREGYADFHALRHTFITRMLRNGVSTYHAQPLARHANIKQTIKYTHKLPAELAQALQQVPSLPTQPMAPATSVAVG